MSRLQETFNDLKTNDKKAFSTFLMSGYPDKETFVDLLKSCSDTGVDFIEVGMPFSDPSADGPTIKKAGTCALENGTTVKDTIDSIIEFRKYDDKTPIVWMGYFNSIFNYGIREFLNDIENAGVDGLLVVDLPVEENHRLEGLNEKNIDLVQLVTPVTPEDRLPLILNSAGGFIYFVSITGITGTKEAEDIKIKSKIEYIKSKTELPVVVGFGIKNPEKAKRIKTFADGAIVGSALVDKISSFLDENNKVKDKEALFTGVKQFIEPFIG